jgi:hypothetical protein
MDCFDLLAMTGSMDAKRVESGIFFEKSDVCKAAPSPASSAFTKRPDEAILAFPKEFVISYTTYRERVLPQFRKLFKKAAVSTLAIIQEILYISLN